MTQMTQNDGLMTEMNQTGETVETVILVPWVIFASGQGLRAEYNTTASPSVGAPLEEAISALCREFHNCLGAQKAPDNPPAVLFWKAQPSHWVLTQVRRAPWQPGQRIAYEYFSIVLTQNDLQKAGNPLHLLERLDLEEWRRFYNAGLREPLTLELQPTAAPQTAAPQTAAPQTPATNEASPFTRGGAWPATADNHSALLAYLYSAATHRQTFATWWPQSQAPRPGVFDLVLRAPQARAARPHELVAITKELSNELSRHLATPPSYDTVSTRFYRALLHGADEVQAMLSEAYFPAALEESPHRWMTRPQKIAGLCQKIADDLSEFAMRLADAYGSDHETARLCIEWAEDYEDLAHDLQKLRHPNILQQGRVPTSAGTTRPHGTPTHQTQARRQTPPKGTHPKVTPRKGQTAAQGNGFKSQRGPRLTDTYFARPATSKSSHAMESPAAKLGSALLLLAISSVAAVGMFMPAEDEQLPSAAPITTIPPTHTPQAKKPKPAITTAPLPPNTPQRVYALAYELSKQRVTTPAGLTRQQRLQIVREALAHVLGGNNSRRNAADTVNLAKQAPDTLKNAAFRGMSHGEKMGIRMKR